MSTDQPELINTKFYLDKTFISEGQPQENPRRSRLPWYQGGPDSKSTPQQIQASKVSRFTEDSSVKPTKLCFTNVGQETPKHKVSKEVVQFHLAEGDTSDEDMKKLLQTKKPDLVPIYIGETSPCSRRWKSGKTGSPQKDETASSSTSQVPSLPPVPAMPILPTAEPEPESHAEEVVRTSCEPKGSDEKPDLVSKPIPTSVEKHLDKFQQELDKQKQLEEQLTEEYRKRAEQHNSQINSVMERNRASLQSLEAHCQFMEISQQNEYRCAVAQLQSNLLAARQAQDLKVQQQEQ